MTALRLGTRGSPLAMAQAKTVADAIEAAHGWAAGAVAIVPVTTTGDRIQDRPLAEVGGKYLWTKELDRCLLSGEVDLCVHSMKDVESVRPDAIAIAAVLPRADARDRLIGAARIEDLRKGARFGTSSPRRAAQIRRIRPDIEVETLRGNVQTRIAKVEAGDVDATLLAAAGLDRLGLMIGSPIDTSVILPAPGQAVIGIECRSEDRQTAEILDRIADRETMACVRAERAFTRALGGSCSSPVAALATMSGDAIRLDAQLFSEEGQESLVDRATFRAFEDDEPERLARDMLGRAPDTIRRLFEAP